MIGKPEGGGELFLQFESFSWGVFDQMEIVLSSCIFTKYAMREFQFMYMPWGGGGNIFSYRQIQPTAEYLSGSLKPNVTEMLLREILMRCRQW